MRMIKSMTIDISQLSRQDVEGLVDLIEAFKKDRDALRSQAVPETIEILKDENDKSALDKAEETWFQEDSPQSEPKTVLPDELAEAEGVEVFKQKIAARFRVFAEHDPKLANNMLAWYKETLEKDPALSVPTRALIWSKFQESEAKVA